MAHKSRTPKTWSAANMHRQISHPARNPPISFSRSDVSYPIPLLSAGYLYPHSRLFFPSSSTSDLQTLIHISLLLTVGFCATCIAQQALLLWEGHNTCSPSQDCVSIALKPGMHCRGITSLGLLGASQNGTGERDGCCVAAAFIPLFIDEGQCDAPVDV